MSEQTVYVVDDDEDVRDSLVELIRSVGLRVQPCASAHEFLDQYKAPSAGCLVLDIRMPGMSGLELQAVLKERQLTLPIIFITGHGDVPMAVQAMKDGAAEFMQKPFRDQDLLDRISKALEQDRRHRKVLEQRQSLAELIENLTPRERQIIDLVIEGQPNKVIAKKLGISDRTVEIHRSHAMQKLEASSVAELVKIMIRAGIG